MSNLCQSEVRSKELCSATASQKPYPGCYIAVGD